MGHYDSQREARDDEENKRRLSNGRKTIVARLEKVYHAMDLLGLKGRDVVYEAIEHLRNKGD